MYLFSCLTSLFCIDESSRGSVYVCACMCVRACVYVCRKGTGVKAGCNPLTNSLSGFPFLFAYVLNHVTD